VCSRMYPGPPGQHVPCWLLGCDCAVAGAGAAVQMKALQVEATRARVEAESRAVAGEEGPTKAQLQVCGAVE
jgi:hypothetical protein